MKQWFIKLLQAMTWSKRTQAPESTKTSWTREEVESIAEEYGQVRYNDGKRDGLAIAREQASRSLREILKQQNRQ